MTSDAVCIDSAVPAAADLRQSWQAQWPQALALWSGYLRLSEPRWCASRAECAAAGLSGSFAMIRLADHAVVIDLEGVAARGLGGFALEIMGHEIGHHVLCPGDLADQARLLSRIRRALAGRAAEAPLVANLYADLLINDRLQRSRDLDMAGVYRQLGRADAATNADAHPSRLWQLYLRIYEHLWRLPRGELLAHRLPPEMEGDALLGARLLRVHGRDWLAGAGGFALLLYPYLDAPETAAITRILGGLLDTRGEQAGEIPDGLTELDEDEETPAIHPADDPALGDGAFAGEEKDEDEAAPGVPPAGRTDQGGRKSERRYRGVAEYGELLRAAGVVADEGEIAIRYYRERALPYLVPFPTRTRPLTAEPEREGVEPWDSGQPLEAIDWVETLTRSAVAIPGVTTVQAVFGSVAGSEPQRQAVDLYLGIDCSGSMPNPRHALSYPVLAGAILALSALRAGARVMACLSGEPGRSIATEGFVASEHAVLQLLTDYLGTGYSYGVGRLAELEARLGIGARPTHIVILSDTDLFSSLDEQDGRHWDLAERVLRRAGGGGTVVLNIGSYLSALYHPRIARLKAQGWQVAKLTDQAQLVDFARRFAAQAYGRPGDENPAPESGILATARSRRSGR